MKNILYFFEWIFYFMITLEDRSNYIHGQRKGLHCISQKDDSYFLYGSARVFEFTDEEPYRTYMNWEEFWAKKEGRPNQKELEHQDVLSKIRAKTEKVKRMRASGVTGIITDELIENYVVA